MILQLFHNALKGNVPPKKKRGKGPDAHQKPNLKFLKE